MKHYMRTTKLDRTYVYHVRPETSHVVNITGLGLDIFAVRCASFICDSPNAFFPSTDKD